MMNPGNHIQAREDLFLRQADFFETPEQILTYHQTRTEIEYFPVVDENETEKRK